jgi:alpha-glucoside transport system permease protein
VVDQLESGVAGGGRAAAPAPPSPGKGSRREGRKGLTAALFLLPACIVLGALVVYPIFFSIVRSMFDANGDKFVGLGNYQEIFASPSTLTALKNNFIWVIIAPTLATVLGLVFAVLTERVRWSTAFKVAVFMPMAISLTASGVIWRLTYEQNPELGLANSVGRVFVDTFRPPGEYPTARPGRGGDLVQSGKALQTSGTHSTGDTVNLGLVGIPPQSVPAGSQPAAGAQPGSGLHGVVWLDFTRGGGGKPNVVDPTEAGLPGMKVEAVASDGSVAASATTGNDGAYAFDGLADGQYTVRLADANFRPPFGGISWLGPSLVTPAIIAVFLWIWSGFAMVTIGAGLSALPREVLEAARTEGASEWQVFRRITVPLLMPVLTVVLVTLAINVLKIFDLIFIIPPGSSQDDANVLALEMYRASFGGGRNEGLGSALAIFLFLLVLPAMIFNFKRFRAENS